LPSKLLCNGRMGVGGWVGGAMAGKPPLPVRVSTVVQFDR